jgi:hypothetical protein
MSLSTFFSPHYLAARDRFRKAALGAGFKLESHEVGGCASSGERLTLDVALRGEGACAVVVSSGIHGVEGYFGSAVQLAFLEKLAGESRTGTRVVLLHPLNPYGFAQGRRVNEDNADLNRNFLPPNEPYRGATEGYRRVNSLLNPTGPRGALPDFFLVRMGTAKLRSGGKLKGDVAQGQYDFPRGLFYGGQARSRTYEVLDGNLGVWIGGAKTILHVDLHTGLGPWATHKLLVSKPSASAAYLRFLKLVPDGGALQDLSVAGGVAYEVRGGMNDWCRTRFPGRTYDVVTAEFGTASELTVLTALREENRAHHYHKPGDPFWTKAKKALLDAFAPASMEWREKVVADGLAIVEAASRAMECSASSAPPL